MNGRMLWLSWLYAHGRGITRHVWSDGSVSIVALPACGIPFELMCTPDKRIREACYLGEES